MIASNPRRLEGVALTLALAFHATGALSLLALGYAPDVILPATFTLIVCGLGARAWLNRVTPARDPLLLPAALLLVGWGLLVIGRVAPNFLGRQTAWLAIAVMAMLAVASRGDNLRWLRRFKYTWLTLGLALLASTLFLGVNPAGEGARLWLSLAGLFVQPSEILRLLMVAFLAAFFSERAFAAPFRIGPARASDQIAALRMAWAAPSVVVWLIAIALLGTQQDLGAAALLLITFASMLYLATGRAILPALGMVALLLAGVAGYALSARVAQRVDIWLNPWADPQNRSFQIAQSLIAVASGSVSGAGIGQGRPDYVPAVHTDFPFAAIGEEMGLLGAIGLFLVFGVLILRGWRVAQQAGTSYAMLLAGGLSASLMAQMFVIIGGNLGLVPLTGVTLPFISYGGSSLLVSFISVGLLIRLSHDQRTEQPARFAPGGDAFHPLPAQRLATRRAMRLSAALIAALSVAAGYWGVARSSELTARSDNPRLVDAERAIRRGPVLARDGTALARSEPIQRGGADRIRQSGSSAPFARRYPHPETAPAVGYASWRHGTGGIETYADATLRGALTPLDRLLHRPQIGAAFTTTLDIALQQRLHRALAGSTGGGIILDWRTGDVLALSSAPSFDPNRLDEDWDILRADARAPLLNRATQGLYQPGPLLQWLYCLDAGRRDCDSQTPGVSPDAEHRARTTWDTGDRFNLGRPVPFELDNAWTPYPATATYSETIGQGTLRVTPLRVAVTVAGLMAGRPVTPTLQPGPRPLSDTERTAPLALAAGRPVIHFAQAGRAQYVGWLILPMRAADADAILVIALEQSNTSPARLRAIARQFE